MVIEFKMVGTVFVCIVYAIGFVVIGIITKFTEYHTNAVMAFQISIIISVVYLHSYVTKNDIAQKKMYINSIMDDVTQTYNKRYFNIKLIEEYDYAIINKDKFAIMVIDIDSFKSVNDRFGHAFGDKLLSAFASEIVSCIREEDIFFRYGGDEFVMLIRKYTDESLGTINDRIKLSIDAVNRKFIKELDNTLSVSIGLAVFPDDSIDIQE
jgi:diguanylate cyclase (GGDEF)-like protein